MGPVRSCYANGLDTACAPTWRGMSTMTLTLLGNDYVDLAVVGVRLLEEPWRLHDDEG